MQTRAAMLTSTVPISVLIPAKDEELNIVDCLESLARADEIFVVDSHSGDRTPAIAHCYGATVVPFYFDGSYPKKKNWALDHLPFRNEWVLIVDCDERIPDRLWDEMADAIQNPAYTGYYLNRRVYFLGRWLRHGGKYPDWNLRLFRHAYGRYENLGTEGVAHTGDNEVHEHVLLQGAAGQLKTDMLHIDLRDIYHWLDRHNRYSNWEAQVYYNLLQNNSKSPQIPARFFGNAVERKRFLKKIWVHLPCRPMLRFLVFYILKLGFLDGRPGYIHACLLSQYEHHIGIKLQTLRHLGGHLNPISPPSTLSTPKKRASSSPHQPASTSSS